MTPTLTDHEDLRPFAVQCTSTPCRVRSGAAWLRTTRAATTPTELVPGLDGKDQLHVLAQLAKLGGCADAAGTTSVGAAGLEPAPRVRIRHFPQPLGYAPGGWPFLVTQISHPIHCGHAVRNHDAAPAGFEPATSPASMGRESAFASVR